MGGLLKITLTKNNGLQHSHTPKRPAKIMRDAHVTKAAIHLITAMKDKQAMIPKMNPKFCEHKY